MSKEKQSLVLEAMEGHQNQTVPRWASWAFCILFLLIIYVIPVHQALHEKIKEGRVQALDLPMDALFNFSKRAHDVDSLRAKLELQLDSLHNEVSADNSGSGDFSERIDAIEFLMQRIFGVWQTANRNLQLDAKNAPALLVETDSLVKKLAKSVRNGEVQAALAANIAEVKSSLASKEFSSVTPRGFSGLMTSVFKHTLFSQKYLRKYEAELEDKSLATLYSRPIMQFLRYALLEDAGDKVVVGKKGWFFYKPGVDYLVRPYMNDPRSFVVDYNDVALTDDPISAIKKFRDQLKERDIELLMVVVPGKASVYPELVNPEMAEVKEPFSHSLKAIEEIRKLDIPVVDLFTPFNNARKLDEKEKDSLYLRLDTHWKLRALKIAAAEIGKQVQNYSWYSDPKAKKAEFVVVDTVVERIGDIGVMSQIPSIKFRLSKLDFPLETTRCEKVYRVYRDTAGAEVRRSEFKDEYKTSRILILGDSFSRIYQTDSPRSAGWISHLAKELDEPLASIVSDGGASTLVRQTLARKANVLKGKKLVIWEFVERDFRYGAEGWKDVDL